MTYQLVPERTPRPRWLELLFLVGLILSLVVAGLAFTGYYQLRRAPTAEVTLPLRPVDALTSERIPARWALLELAEAHPKPLLHQAVAAGEQDLAYAILVFGLDIPGADRATEAVRLGFAFAEEQRPVQAAGALAMARTVAIFDRSLPPLERGQILAQVAQGYLRLGATAPALDAARQAQHLAVQTPDLLPAHRVRILDALTPVMESAAPPETLRRWQELRRSPQLNLGRTLLPPLLAGLYLPPPSPSPPDQAVAQAIAVRQEAAQRLAERLAMTGGVDFEPERQALAQALLAEDQARSQAMTAVPGEPVDRFLHIQERRRWSLVKLRAAYGGYGIVLVPEWEAQIPSLWSELTRTTEELLPVLEALTGELTDPVQRAMGRSEALQWLAYQAELGFYPQAPLGELATRIEEAQAELERLGLPPALPIFYDVSGTPPGFRIAPRY